MAERPKKGDWECPHCKAYVFGSKDSCCKCDALRPEDWPDAEPRQQRRSSSGRGGSGGRGGRGARGGGSHGHPYLGDLGDVAERLVRQQLDSKSTQQRDFEADVFAKELRNQLTLEDLRERRRRNRNDERPASDERSQPFRHGRSPYSPSGDAWYGGGGGGDRYGAPAGPGSASIYGGGHGGRDHDGRYGAGGYGGGGGGGYGPSRGDSGGGRRDGHAGGSQQGGADRRGRSQSPHRTARHALVPVGAMQVADIAFKPETAAEAKQDDQDQRREMDVDEGGWKETAEKREERKRLALNMMSAWAEAKRAGKPVHPTLPGYWTSDGYTAFVTIKAAGGWWVDLEGNFHPVNEKGNPRPEDDPKKGPEQGGGGGDRLGAIEGKAAGGEGEKPQEN
ncbi:hypothetical protein DFJ74DRAFT_191507 [Hyaloraphidium curvatum]|nr:hypothetical protein DFJ74DRAFT_191507 [Hyaloraphidium curvatum]